MNFNFDASNHMNIIRVVSTRLYGYTPGQQQFDYPVKDIKVSSGSQTITVAIRELRQVCSRRSGALIHTATDLTSCLPTTGSTKDLCLMVLMVLLRPHLLKVGPSLSTQTRSRRDSNYGKCQVPWWCWVVVHRCKVEFWSCVCTSFVDRLAWIYSLPTAIKSISCEGRLLSWKPENLLPPSPRAYLHTTLAYALAKCLHQWSFNFSCILVHAQWHGATSRAGRVHRLAAKMSHVVVRMN